MYALTLTLPGDPEIFSNPDRIAANKGIRDSSGLRNLIFRYMRFLNGFSQWPWSGSTWLLLVSVGDSYKRVKFTISVDMSRKIWILTGIRLAKVYGNLVLNL